MSLDRFVMHDIPAPKKSNMRKMLDDLERGPTSDVPAGRQPGGGVVGGVVGGPAQPKQDPKAAYKAHRDKMKMGDQSFRQKFTQGDRGHKQKLKQLRDKLGLDAKATKQKLDMHVKEHKTKLQTSVEAHKQQMAMKQEAHEQDTSHEQERQGLAQQGSLIEQEAQKSQMLLDAMMRQKRAKAVANAMGSRQQMSKGLPTGDMVHQPGPLAVMAAFKRKKKPVADPDPDPDPEGEREFDKLYVPICKVDAEERIIYGFANVSTNADGSEHFDTQGHHIPSMELRKAFHTFMQKKRNGGYMHMLKAGHIVEGIVIDSDVKKALGMPKDGPEGLFIGYKCASDAVWDAVKKGELTGFSIGGRGKLHKVA